MNNEEKNTYVKRQITSAVLDLIKEYDWNEISISQITTAAMVSRNSFYRNYECKEDVLDAYVRRLILGWKTDFDHLDPEEDHDIYLRLFQYLYTEKEFYILLQKKGLLYLVLDVIREIFGSQPGETYGDILVSAFIAYGLYGWIEAWIAHGMEESPDLMAYMLHSEVLN